MIVVFVVDTSPSMKQSCPCSSSNSSNNGRSYSNTSSMPRIDLAKCLCEQLVKSLDRRIMEHNHAAISLMLMNDHATNKKSG